MSGSAICCLEEGREKGGREMGEMGEMGEMEEG